MKKKLKTDAGELVCLYIRSERYDSSSWNVFAGKRNLEFEKYVKETDASLCELQKIKSLTLPTGEVTDFVHMMATLNMYYKESGALGGWAGDVAQMGLNIKNEKGTLEDLTNKVSFFMGADKDSYFGKEDFYADLDAANIYTLTKNYSLPVAMGIYYKDLTPQKRVRDFVENTFSPKSLKKEKFRETVYSAFTITPHINSLLENFSLYGNAYKNHIKACAYGFADYLLYYYEPEPSSIYVEPVKNINLNNKNNFILSYHTVPETDFEISVVLPENGNLYMEDGIIYFRGPGTEKILLFVKEYPEIQTEITVKGVLPNNSTTTDDIISRNESAYNEKLQKNTTLFIGVLSSCYRNLKSCIANLWYKKNGS